MRARGGKREGTRFGCGIVRAQGRECLLDSRAQVTDPLSIDALKAQVLARPLPRHVGIIMDGNGRWAQLRGQERLEGHRKGSDSVRNVTRASRRLGLEALTLYAFSAQNWQRPPAEVEGLMELLREYIVNERAEIMDNGIRLHAIGQLDRIPPRVREPLEELRALSAGNDKMTLTLALSYGGREEIVAMTQQIAREAAAGTLKADDIDFTAIEQRLWTQGLPPLELVVRTSGEVRVSNFLLWQLAYAELHLTETLWPDFGERELLIALDDFQRRERRFGKTSTQLRTGA
ncbi:MAG: di-trans,poly-cis-decaprenylcistransferase [Deltaproteobacteria bacterium]|nr:di-trans,poly-cis-decaprenylcistransferase [Deltaproteobacteria bacterium]